MQRERKYRGISLDTGKWVYGYGVVVNTEHDLAIIINQTANNLLQHNAVDPKTVTDYTGLKDKNCEEIYEDDILSGGISKNGVVTFENGTFIVWGDPICYDFESFDEKPEVSPTEIWANVIGNIYENPELIQN